MNKIVSYTPKESKTKQGFFWLIIAVDYMEKQGYFDFFDQINVKMKEVNYSVKQKLITIICSIVVCCGYTKDINSKLVPDEATAEILGMKRFPDQSQINILLRRFDENNIIELKQMHENIFKNNSLSFYMNETKIIDIDQTSLIANGKTYELAEKGYFPKKKNQKGYKVSVAYSGNSKEALSLYLEKGNTDEFNNMENILNDMTKFYDVDSLENIIIRADAGYGSEKGIKLLKKI
jgi:hypothetical protein